jgi:CRISPR-associated protein Cmr1
VNPDYPAYAVFPFQGGKDGDPSPAEARRNVSFQLALDYDGQHQKDVHVALWAWLNFGGLGARTRRGCGALYCRDFAPPDGTPATVRQWVQESFKKYAIKLPKDRQDWPTMWSFPIVGRHPEPPMAAWRTAVDLLKVFRQGEGIGRNPGHTRTKPGRSRWPEPDSLRTLTGLSEPRHMGTQTVAEPAFPRAEFGLPIVFHFTNNDPADAANNCELYPKDGNRMASPVILRPLAVGDGTTAVPMVLLLGVEPVHDVELRKIGVSPTIGDSQIRRLDLATYANSPMKGTADGSALGAFLKFAGKALST